MERLGAVVMAGGYGKRMNTEKPKVLHKLAGRPMILFTLDTFKALGVHDIVVVVGYQAEQMKKAIGSGVHFAVQKEPLGTGHALQTALKELPKTVQVVLSAYGDDSAFYRVETLKAYVAFFLASHADMACLTVVKDDPTGLGRMLRGKDDQINGIIEEKLASDQQKKIREVNTGCYVFRRELLEELLPRIGRNQTGEYFLTDIVQLALIWGYKVVSYRLPNPDEWVGINTPEQLAVADGLMRKRLKGFV